MEQSEHTLDLDPTRRLLKWGGSFPFFKISKLIDEDANIAEVCFETIYGTFGPLWDRGNVPSTLWRSVKGEAAYSSWTTWMLGDLELDVGGYSGCASVEELSRESCEQCKVRPYTGCWGPSGIGIGLGERGFRGQESHLNVPSTIWRLVKGEAIYWTLEGWV